MADIVKGLRLLVPSDSSGAVIKAIDEITCLRNELRIAQEWSVRVIAGQEEDANQITALRAENERLRAAGNAIIDFYNGPLEAKRPDIFHRLMVRLNAALEGK